MKKRIKDLANWPTHISAAFLPRGGTFPNSLDQVIIKKVVRIDKTSFEFICTFSVTNFNYPFSEKDVKTSEKLWTIFQSNIGKSLSSVGEEEIPED